MQESWARLHGWRRRGRMAGGGSGGGLGSKRKGVGGGGGLDEKQLPQDGGVWMGVLGGMWGGGGSRPHFAILLCSRPGLCWRPGGAGGSESALTRPRFSLPIRVRTDRGFQVRQALTPLNLCLLTNDDR